MKVVAVVQAGTVLAGRYRLDQRVGSGGMGEVWRAHDQVLDRVVAVKCLLDGRPDEPNFVDQFRTEARIMATISHPGVVEVHDFGDDPAAGVYLVMKFIDGESLAQTLARVGRLDAAATMRLVAQAAEALHAAHAKGVTHRDIKPGNLLVRPDGSTLVTDFGIARSAGAAGFTTTGMLVGTAGYLAPERAMGQPATPATDIYALGVVAYRCLAGRLPFAGDSMVELALRHVHDQPDPLPPDVPPAVRAMVARAMAKDPAQRWPSAAALAAAAREASAPVPGEQATASLPTRPQAVAPVPTRRQTVPDRRGGRRLLLPVAAGLIVAAVAATAFVLSQSPDTPSPNVAASPSGSVPSPAGRDDTVGVPTSPAVTSPVPSASAASPKARVARSLVAPNNLTATAVGPDTIRLRWRDRSASETGFTVINGSTSHDVPANTTSYDWTGLSPATHSCFKVRAFDASGVTAYFPAAQGNWVCATSLDGSGPAAPTNLSATAVDAGTIRLQWSDNAADETGFTITNGNTSRNVSADTTTYQWDGLAAGTYMCFKVRAYHSGGVSAYAPAASTEWACVTTPST
ncbi:protein kinase domain-containing protein [Catellatospora methionotrophica]|uniref:protein kinase domain-containing protein n=1 Tax=Catellatospora methionotrophica TaxID=121620 RepID=UPI0033D9D510